MITTTSTFGRNAAMILEIIMHKDLEISSNMTSEI